MAMGGSDGSILPFFSFAKTSSNVSEIPRTNDDTNVQYSENIHKEDSQPQLPENNSDLDTIHTECEEITKSNFHQFGNKFRISTSARFYSSIISHIQTNKEEEKKK